MPRFLFVAKNCHSCAKRSNCQKKDSRENLVDKVRVFEHVNRSTIRHGMPPYKIQSFCRDFVPEEKETTKIPKQIELTTEALQEALKMQGNKLTIVDVWAPWCAPCRVISPAIEEIAKEFPEVNVNKVNIDDNPEYGEKYNIMGIPTILFLRKGKEIDRIVGVKADIKEIIEKKIKELLR